MNLNPYNLRRILRRKSLQKEAASTQVQRVVMEGVASKTERLADELEAIEAQVQSQLDRGKLYRDLMK